MTQDEIAQMAKLTKEFRKLKEAMDTWDQKMATSQDGFRRALELENFRYRGYTIVIDEIPA